MTKEDLEKRVIALECELEEREKDLVLFRNEVLRANKRLESILGSLGHKVELMQMIQKALVPTEIPKITGFEFSTKFVSGTEVGGDYFDIFEHDDRVRFGIIASSASGQGVSALLLSILLEFTRQMEARFGSEPDEVVGKIAQRLVANMKANSRVDLFYGLLDRRNHEFSFCRMGEVIALRYDYDGKSLELLEPTGGPIVETYTSTRSSQSLILNPRDRLIICTKGVIEEKSSLGECYGEERLFEVVLKSISKETHGLRNEILFQLQQFSGQAEPQRDMSVIVVDVKDRVIRLAL